VKLKSAPHRIAIILAGAVLGLLTVTAGGVPTSANNAWVKGEATCVNGKDVVTWKFTNHYQADATVQDLQLPPGSAPLSADGKDLHNGLVLSSGETDFIQVVEPSDTAKISFTAYWPQPEQGTDSDNRATVVLPAGCGSSTSPDCVHAQDAGLTHTFKVDQTGATTIVYLSGAHLCDTERINVTSVSYYTPGLQATAPQFQFDQDWGYVSNENPVLALWVKTPPCHTQVVTFVGAGNQVLSPSPQNAQLYGDLRLGSPRGPGSVSKGPPAWYAGGSPACVTPASTSVPNCDGSQMINLANSGTLAETFTVKFGKQVKTVNVAANHGQPVAIRAGAGPVTVSAPGIPDQIFNWSPPGTCVPPTVTIINTCANVTVLVNNPRHVPTARVVVTYGVKTKKLTVGAGFAAKTTFVAGTATYATVKFAGADHPVQGTLKKLTCPARAAGNDDDQSRWPVSRFAATVLASGVAILLIIGGVLFFLARRRKESPTT